MIRVKIRDVLGIRSAEVELDGVVLVGGVNGSGKSSLLQCAGAVLLKQWPIRGISKKGEAGQIVRKGAVDGTVMAQWERGAYRIIYSTKDAPQQDQSGRPLDPEPHPVALGTLPYMALPSETRMKLVTEAWNAYPSRDDAAQWCREHNEMGIDPAEKVEGSRLTAFSILWDDIDVQGWDPLARRYVNEATRLTGSWKEATGTNWGSNIRLTWAPPGLFPDQEYSADAAADKVLAARGRLSELRTQRGIAAAELARLQEEAGKVPGLKLDIAAHATAAGARAEEANRKAQELEENPLPADPALDPTCPHCSGALLIRRGPPGGPTILVEKPPARMTKAAATAARTKHEALVVQAQALNDAVKADHADGFTLAERLRVAEDAARQLDDAKDAPAAVTDEEFEQATEAVTLADAHLVSVKRLLRSRELSAQWDATKAIAMMLLPEGLRAEVFNRRLSELNTELSKVSSQAGMLEVSMTADGDLTYAARRYALLSESERWRCDFVMARTLGNRQGMRLQIIDRFDVLDPGSREAVIYMLHKSRVLALIAMMAPDVSKVPDLAKHKVGRRMWISDGVLTVPGMAPAGAK